MKKIQENILILIISTLTALILFFHFQSSFLIQTTERNNQKRITELDNTIFHLKKDIYELKKELANNKKILNEKRRLAMYEKIKKDLKEKKRKEIKKKIENLKRKKKIVSVAESKNNNQEIQDSKSSVKKENMDYTSEPKNFKQITIPHQGKGSNTCVIDNLSFMLEYVTGRKLNKTLIYKEMGKSLGDYWHSGDYYLSKYGGKIEPTSTNRDYEVLKEVTGIELYDSTNIWYLKSIIKQKEKVVVMEVPMSIIEPNNPYWKKEDNSNVYHAITVTRYNQKDNTLEYINSLTGKVETLDFETLVYEKDNAYLKFPFRYFKGEVEEYNQKFLL